jgi:hypothetical protein
MITEEDIDRLEKLSCESKYWKDSYNFMQKILKLPKEYLSESQIAWLEQILEDIQK